MDGTAMFPLLISNSVPHSNLRNLKQASTRTAHTSHSSVAAASGAISSNPLPSPQNRSQGSLRESHLPLPSPAEYYSAFLGAVSPSTFFWVLAMWVPELRHPLCCISIDCPGFGGRSPAPSFQPEDSRGGESPPSYDAVAGVLCKWTNIGKGWRHRWFSLEGGVLTYSKIRRRDPTLVPAGGGVRLIGSAAAAAASTGCRKAQKPVRVVRHKVSKR